MMDYTIGSPVIALPPILRRSDDQCWSRAYRAARKAQGQWVPVQCGDRVEARKLKDVSKKQPGIEAVLRSDVVYLRVRP